MLFYAIIGLMIIDWRNDANRNPKKVKEEYSIYQQFRFFFLFLYKKE